MPGKFFRFQHKCCRTLEEAFQDLRGLMTKAQEMVQLAEKFRETLVAKGDSSQSETLDPEMQQQLIEIGIASPVTKELAGAAYHNQLSRQVTELQTTWSLPLCKNLETNRHARLV